MKNLKQLLFIIIFLSNKHSLAQSGMWMWVRGADTINSVGSFGTKGVPSATNEPPARYQPAFWKDLNGNFWIFAGNLAPNDLWKYNPINNEWTWVRGKTAGPVYGTMGVPSTLNNPPKLGYGANCWTDDSGDLWLYAGINFSNWISNDVLWRYHIATDEWTWMKGDPPITNFPNYGIKGIPDITNTPGTRNECKAGWVYDKKLWFFGGSINPDLGNDMWSYDIATNNWTWESGTDMGNDLGNYGAKGVPDVANMPPARWSYTRWFDGVDKFYIFGGVSIMGTHNDLWEYSLKSKIWTWVGGTDIIYAIDSISKFCDPDVNAPPNARYENLTLSIINNCPKTLWNFGGFDQTGNSFNDMWVLSLPKFEWTKLKGTFGKPAPHNFGFKGIASPPNLIPSKGGGAIWLDNASNIFVFGGGFISSSGPMVYTNDLWKFIPDTSCFRSKLISGVKLKLPTDTLLCLGDTTLMAIPADCSIEIFPPKGSSIDYGAKVLKFVFTEKIKYTIVASSKDTNDPCFKNDTISFTLNERGKPVANFNLSPAKAYIDNPKFTFLNLSFNAIKYEWYYKDSLISTSRDFVFNFPNLGSHCVTLIATNICGYKDTITKCCYVMDTAVLSEISDFTLCLGDTAIIDLPNGVTAEITPNSDYSIDSSISLLKIFPKKTTNYIVKTKPKDPSDSLIKEQTFNITINVNQPPIAKFDIDPLRAFKSNPKFNFYNRSIDAVSYEWFYEGKLISRDKDIAKTFPEEGEYCITLVATNICNKKDTSIQCCLVYGKGKLLIPNAFTPNGDGINDGFKALLTIPYLSYSIMIMNRWGEEVFNATSPNKIWDGTFKGMDEETGVYYYLIKIKYEESQAEEMYKGDITLIR